MLENITTYNQENFVLQDRYLWIWNPTSIPPHMGMSISGSYFSLKANGVDIKSDLLDLIAMINRKKLPVLAVKLNSEFGLDLCETVFSLHQRTIANEVTCLHPIKSVLGLSSPKKLSELLIELQLLGVTGTITSWNIDEKEIELPEYTTEDIHAHLDSLSKK